MIIKADAVAGLKNLERIKFYPELNARASKEKELVDFGISRQMISRWLGPDNPPPNCECGEEIWLLISVARECMQRLKTDSNTKLGLYIDSIRNIVQSRFKKGTVLDFGCGMWIDASLSIVLDSNLEIELSDIAPLRLAFSAYQLARRRIPHRTIYSKNDRIMIIESTSFEHVKGINTFFEALVETLPKGGFLLSNYTCANPNRLDGYEENKQFQPEAKKIANRLMRRYKWQPEQSCWDLWEKI